MTARSIAPLALALALLALFAAGCGGSGGSAGDDSATTPSEALQDITLGAGLDTSGAIELGWAKEDFPLGDPIYLAMNVSNAKENAEIDVQWLGPDGQVLAHETKRALPEREFMSWQAPDEVTLAGDGQYRVKVLYQGKEAATLDFRITPYEAGEEKAPAASESTSGAGSNDKGTGSGSDTAGSGSQGTTGSNGSGGDSGKGTGPS